MLKTTLRGYQMSSVLEDRFWSKVRKTSFCWIWTAGKFSQGYGGFKINGKTEKAHRISWTLTYGEIPDGLDVLHDCDNRPCVRPNHLFLGTHQDNMTDMVNKGRSKKGESNGRAKLTQKEVLQLRAGKEISTQVSPRQLKRILTEEQWNA